MQHTHTHTPLVCKSEHVHATACCSSHQSALVASMHAAERVWQKTIRETTIGGKRVLTHDFPTLRRDESGRYSRRSRQALRSYPDLHRRESCTFLLNSLKQSDAFSAGSSHDTATLICIEQDLSPSQLSKRSDPFAAQLFQRLVILICIEENLTPLIVEIVQSDFCKTSSQSIVTLTCIENKSIISWIRPIATLRATHRNSIVRLFKTTLSVS